MRITVIRIAKKGTYTIGKLYVDGVYCCDTLEDVDRMFDDSMPLVEIQRRKVKNQTAIPTGVYKVDLGTFSPTFGNIKFYRDTCGGKLPRLMNVKAYQGVLIHCGNTPSDTAGCILVGENKVVGKVINSKECFKRLFAKLWNAKNLTIEIKRNY